MKRFKPAALLVFSLAIIFFLFFDFSKHDPVLGASNPFAEDPFDAVGSFGIQLAFVSALLTMLHAFRPTKQIEGASEQALLLLRAGTVSLLSVIITLGADGIGLVRAVLTYGDFPAAGPLVAMLSGMAFITLTVGWTFFLTSRRIVLPPVHRPWRRAVFISLLAILILVIYPLRWRNSGVLGGTFTAMTGMVLIFITVWGNATALLPMTEQEYKDIFDNLKAIIQDGEKRVDWIAAPIKWMGKLASFPLVREAIGWLNPRRHRWNLVLAAAVLMGLFLVLAEATAEGMAPNLGRELMVMGVYITIEGSGVVLGYLFFGKYLGIFRVE